MMVYLEYQLIFFFCLWSFSEYTTAAGPVALMLLVDRKVLQYEWYKKVGWYALGAMMIYQYQWYALGSLIMLVNGRWLDNFVISTLYDFGRQRWYGTPIDSMDDHGWLLLNVS